MRPMLTAFLAVAMITTAMSADEPIKEGGWVISRDPQTGAQIHTMEMTLHPKAEPRPALKYRIIPDDFDLRDGNAAIHYLKALGFLEQNPARQRLTEFQSQAMERARKEGKEFDEVAPFSWRIMAPEELPLEEVKEYLRFTNFQVRWLRDAVMQRRFKMDRNIRSVDNPIGYLLPEIQSIREIARNQSVRCKVAIAEGRTDDAIEILGQQYAMARHVAQDDFLVSNLVGIACAGIAWSDALYLVQHPDTPNLYWAFASMPTPLIDLGHSLPLERQLLYMQVKTLREVDDTPRPAGYWQDFIDRLAIEIDDLPGMLDIPPTSDDPAVNRAALAAFVALAYPSAKHYLTTVWEMTPEKVEAYPTAQTVFLALVRYYEEARDTQFKWTYIPLWQADKATRGMHGQDVFAKSRDQAGWIAEPATMLLPAVHAARTAAARLQQQLAFVQTVEAIRMYGAAHNGTLPPSLDDLPVPVPPEPFTGKPLDYRCHGSYAILNGHDMPGLRYRLVLRFARGAK